MRRMIDQTSFCVSLCGSTVETSFFNSRWSVVSACSNSAIENFPVRESWELVTT